MTDFIRTVTIPLEEYNELLALKKTTPVRKEQPSGKAFYDKWQEKTQQNGTLEDLPTTP